MFLLDGVSCSAHVASRQQPSQAEEITMSAARVSFEAKAALVVMVTYLLVVLS